MQYLMVRGDMHCAVGDSFIIRYPLRGVTPHWPAPKSGVGKHSLQVDRMASYLDEYAKKIDHASDTYWCGKDIVRLAKHMFMAKSWGHESDDSLCETLTRALSNWFI